MIVVNPGCDENTLKQLFYLFFSEIIRRYEHTSKLSFSLRSEYLLGGVGDICSGLSNDSMDDDTHASLDTASLTKNITFYKENLPNRVDTAKYLTHLDNHLFRHFFLTTVRIGKFPLKLRAIKASTNKFAKLSKARRDH